MEKRYFENEFAEFWIEDEILFFIYRPGVIINLEAAKKIVDDRLKLQKGVAYPVFCDTRGIKNSDKAARDYLAKEGSELVTAVGILIGSPVTKVMVNFYLAINQPLTPTRMFTDKNVAIDYVLSYRVHTT